MESEVARLKQRIEQECQALRLALNGPAEGASHKAIMARYERLGACQAELERLIGLDAEEVVGALYHRCME
ncbi:MAG TPA: hypothetical protein VGF67_25445 [Ktedonobacteraceae bacterium]